MGGGVKQSRYVSYRGGVMRGDNMCQRFGAHVISPKCISLPGNKMCRTGRCSFPKKKATIGLCATSVGIFCGPSLDGLDHPDQTNLITSQ